MGVKTGVAPADAVNVAATVVVAAYDTLVRYGMTELDAAATLSTIGASPASLVELIERRNPHFAVYSFDMAWSTHDLLRQGITEYKWTRVVVAAPTEHEAALTAQQMVACHGMPTRQLYRY
jgi:hypothetical protein